MKKLLLLTIALLSITLSSQNVFRLDKQGKATIKNISPETLNTILFVEIALQKNANQLKEGSIKIYDPYVGTIQSAYKNNRLSNKEIDKINKIICLDCYKKEWDIQKSKTKKEGSSSTFVNKKEVSKKEQNNQDLSIKAIRNRMSNFNEQSAKEFADKIAQTAKTNYEYYKQKSRPKHNSLAFYYLKSNLTAEQLQDIKDFGCNQNCFKVYFDVYYKGANEDLEIKGTKKIIFSNVSGKFLDLFPTWNREFIQSSTKEGILDYKKKTIYNGNIAVARFQKMQGIWIIRYYNF